MNFYKTTRYSSQSALDAEMQIYQTKFARPRAKGEHPDEDRALMAALKTEIDFAACHANFKDWQNGALTFVPRSEPEEQARLETEKAEKQKLEAEKAEKERLQKAKADPDLKEQIIDERMDAAGYTSKFWSVLLARKARKERNGGAEKIQKEFEQALDSSDAELKKIKAEIAAA